MVGPGAAGTPQGDGAEALIFRDNAGGKYYNSIITEYNGQGGGAIIRVEDLGSGVDSRNRLEAGDLVLSNNIWWGFGGGSSAADSVTLVPQDFVRHYFFAPVNNNQIVDPQITGVSRTDNYGLDPRPSPTGPAATGAISPSDGFFAITSYYGAFNPYEPVWIDGWTALAENQISTGINTELGIPAAYSLAQNYPNPFNPTTTILFTLPRSEQIELKIFDMLGREVATLLNEFRSAGEHQITFDAGRLSTGIYSYRISAGSFIEIRKMMLVK